MNILPPQIPKMPISEPPKKLQRMRDMRDNKVLKNIIIPKSAQQFKPSAPYYPSGEKYPMYIFE